jgi:putative copper export protein
VLFFVEAAVSGIGYLTLALSVGTLLTAGFLLPDLDDAMRRKLAVAARFFLGAFLLVGIFAVIVQGVKLSAGALPSLDIMSRYLTRTQSGKIWLGRELYVLFLLAFSSMLLRKRTLVGGLRLLFFLVLTLVATRGLTGHAVAARENPLLLIGADAIHMICVTLWAGGLPVLCWLLVIKARQTHESPYWPAQAVTRFSRVALISVCLLAASGLYQALIHVRDLPTLLNTSYGNVLTFKLMLFGVMAALGTMNRFLTKPALLRAASSAVVGPRAAKAYLPIGWEGVLGCSVFIVTGFLTTLPPGVHSGHSLTQQQGETLSQHAHSPASRTVLAPADGATVKIIVPAPGEVIVGDQVPLRFKFVKGKRGHHVHAYVDGELMGMFDGNKGTLTGIAQGNHVLVLRVVAEDHQTEIDAADRVDFVVKPKNGGNKP